MRRSRVAGVLVLAILVALVFAARFYLRGAAFVVQAAGIDGAARTATRWYATDVTVSDRAPVPWRAGALRARAYRPSRQAGRPILLVPGVHASGIDEPRLVGFARDIAATGHPVLTVELPDLKRYAITTRTTDMIEDAASWMLRTPEFRGADDRIGILGISFGGGLSVVAAGQPLLQPELAGVLAVALTKEEEHVRFRRRRSSNATGEALMLQTYDYLPNLKVVPIDVIQSTNDGYLPAAQARELFGPDTERRRLIAIESGNHSFSDAREELYAAMEQSLQWLSGTN